jgi:hypothetical protein
MKRSIAQKAAQTSLAGLAVGQTDFTSVWWVARFIPIDPNAFDPHQHVATGSQASSYNGDIHRFHLPLFYHVTFDVRSCYPTSPSSRIPNFLTEWRYYVGQRSSEEI